ncbi:MAG: hypothetical protein ACOVQG_10465 [Crocinitomicaceae bacterium]|jgi:hypothetical protein
MNKDTLNSKDDWEGVLASRFEEDIQLPPVENWTGVEKELFPTKKRRFAALWIAASVLLLGGLGVYFFQRSTVSDTKIKVKIEPQKVLNKPKNKPQQKLVLTEKDGVSKSKNAELKVNSERIPSSSNQKIQNKNIEIAFLENRMSNSKNKSGKSSKSKRNVSNNENQTTNSSANSTLTTEIGNNKNEESQNHENSDNETITYTNISSENSSINAKIQDWNIRLKLLPVQLISTVQFYPIQEETKKDKTDFKPYFSLQVAPLIGRNIRIISGSFNSNNTNSNALGDRRASLPKYGFQTALNYHLNKRLSIKTGFQLAEGDFQSRWFFKYLQIDPTTNDIRLKTTSGEASTTDPTLLQSITNGTSGIYKLRINHAFSLYSIPIGITYRFTGQRFSPYIRTGLNMEFFGRRTLSLDVLENGIARNIELNLNRPSNRLNLQAMFALGLETSVNNKWSLFTEAGYYVPLNQYVNSNGYSVRIAGSSILGGVRYEFKK